MLRASVLTRAFLLDARASQYADLTTAAMLASLQGDWETAAAVIDLAEAEELARARTAADFHRTRAFFGWVRQDAVTRH